MMANLLEVKNIDKETSEAQKLATEILINIVEQTSDYLVHSKIHMKTEPQEDENLDCDIMGNHLDVNSVIKVAVEEDISSKQDYKIKHKTEEIGEKDVEDNLTRAEEPESSKNSGPNNKTLEEKQTLENKEYTCNVCHKIFALKCSFYRHRRIHTGIKPYSCNICTKSFFQKSHLVIHMFLHSDEKPHVCNICKKSYSQKSSLKYHILTHSDVKPFSCTDCNKSFTHEHDLIKHKRVHTSEKPYACDLCAKAFRNSSNLLRHKRIHTGLKPYTCDICKLSLTAKSNLIRHLKTHEK